MATGLIEGALVGEAVAKLSDAIIDVIKQTAKFKPNLRKIQGTIKKIKPIFLEIEKYNKILDRPKEETDGFINRLKDAEVLVRKCEKINWINLYKRYKHSVKLDDVDSDLLKFFQFDVQLQQTRDIKEVLVVAKGISERMGKKYSRSSSIPLLQGTIVGFDEPLRNLRGLIVDDGEPVVVVSAAGGCGKTTLVTMLCHDQIIKGKFGDNIFFATVSNTPNLKVVVSNLFKHCQIGQQPEFLNDEDAINQLGSMLEDINSDILLVLDDVWDVSIINKFKFELPRYRLLVTSRFVYSKFYTYMLEPLSDSDATKLFHLSAFSKERHDISEDLVNKMVKCCKKHPLALTVIGGSLNGQHVAIWKSTLKTLSDGHSVLDLNKDMLIRLGKSLDALDKPFLKQCYLDLGLFPEDQRIPATALMDMWVHLYDHDEEGTATLTDLFELSHRNLATLLPRSEDSLKVVNYCEEQFVSQHDMLRELAIHLSSQDPIVQRERLIINSTGENLPRWIEQLQQPVHARLMSISTDESFSSRWPKMQVPEAEVFVLNFMARKYTLPQFLETMDKLKVLLVTNYGLYPTQLENFQALGHLSSLKTIRLERICIPSLSKSILQLVNLRKISLIMCEIGKAFQDCTDVIPNMFPSLEEIEIAYCHDLQQFPEGLCSLVNLKRLCISKCHELGALPNDLWRLKNLEVLRLNSCTKLAYLPESIGSLHELSILDISDCLSIYKLPDRIGELCGLRMIHMKGCTGLSDLPHSVEDLRELEVVCDEEISYLWRELLDVKINVVNEDKVANLMSILSSKLGF